MTRSALVLLLAGCTFTTATGFDECQVDTDCGSTSACLQHFCIKMPDGCMHGFGSFGDPQRVTFAAVLPLTDNTGAPDDSEKAGLNAFNLAVDEMNQRMGANGRNFAVYVCDTQRSENRAKTQGAWMAQQTKVPTVITSGSQQTLTISFATRDAGTMIMSATSTSPELVGEFENSGELLWRTAPPDTLQSRVLANLLLTDPTYTGVTNIGIIYVGDPYGSGLEAGLLPRLRNAGRNVTTVPFDTGADVSAAVTGLANANVQTTVVIAVTSDTKHILQKAFTIPKLTRAMGHKWAFADASKDPDILTVAGAITELAGSLGTAPAQGAGVPFPTFQGAYTTRFGIDPSSYSFTSHSYDAMYLLGLCASYATSADRKLDGRTMADAMKLVSSGTVHNLEPSEFTPMRNALSAGTSIDVEGNSGHLDYIPMAGAPYSKMEEWRIEGDAGFSTVTLIDPPMN